MNLALNALVDIDAVNEYFNFKTDDNTSRDNFLIRKINEVSDLAAQYMNRNLTKQTYTEKFTGNNRQYLVLNNYPIIDIAYVNFFGLALVDDQYECDDYWKARGMIFKETGWTANNFLVGLAGDEIAGRKVIEVQYDAGYETIPYDVQGAVIDLVALKFKESPWSDNRLGIEMESEGSVRYTYSKKEIAIPPQIASVFDRYAKKRV